MTTFFAAVTQQLIYDQLIHSANPQSQHVVITIFTLVLRLYVRPHISKSCQSKQISVKIVIATVGLAEWISELWSIFLSQSMELLILSKLKWDLTAITAFNYLDHLLAIFQRSELGSNNTTIDPDHLYSLRRQTERLITLCATESSFLGQPPSRVASASLASAVQQDFESHPPTSVNINDVLEKLQSCTRIEMVRDICHEWSPRPDPQSLQ